MSDHGREHTHNGLGGATVTFLILGALEIILGITVHNPAVSNLGVHDLSDGALPTMAVVVGMIAIRLKHHWPSCQAEAWAVFLFGVSNIVVIGGFTILSIPSSVSKDQLILGIGSGIVSFAANYYWAKELHNPDYEVRHAASKHFRLDAYAAVAVGVGSSIAYWIGNIWPAIAAAGIVLILTMWHSGPDMYIAAKKFHRKRNHVKLVHHEHSSHHHH